MFLYKYWLHILCIILFVLNVSLSLMYFKTSKCPVCETCTVCEDFDFDQYIVDNTEIYSKYIESIKKFFLQFSQVLVKDEILRNAINSSELVKNLMYTNETNSEFTAMVHFLHGGTVVSKKYQFDEESFSKKYGFPNNARTTGMNGISMLFSILLNDIKKTKQNT